MGMWGTYTLSFEIENQIKKTGEFMKDDIINEIVADVFATFQPFSRCEGGLSFHAGAMFEPDFCIKVRYEGSFSEAKFLAACNRVIKKYAHFGYDHACVQHSLDWSSEEDFWYLSDSGDYFEYDKDYSEYVTERNQEEMMEELRRLGEELES